MHSRACGPLTLVLAVSFLAISSLAQEKTGTKQDVEKRLKSNANPAASSALDNVVKTLFAAHTFEEVALSPDAKRIAWVEAVHTKTGSVPAGARSEERRVGKEGRS